MNKWIAELELYGMKHSEWIRGNINVNSQIWVNFLTRQFHNIKINEFYNSLSSDSLGTEILVNMQRNAIMTVPPFFWLSLIRSYQFNDNHKNYWSYPQKSTCFEMHMHGSVKGASVQI